MIRPRFRFGIRGWSVGFWRNEYFSPSLRGALKGWCSVNKKAVLLLVLIALSLLALVLMPEPGTGSGSLPPSVAALTADRIFESWPPYIRHHGKTDSLASEIDGLKTENDHLAGALERALVAIEGLSTMNRVLIEGLKEHRERLDAIQGRLPVPGQKGDLNL